MTQSSATFETLRSQLRFRGQLIARTGLRIGAGRDTDVAGHDLPVMRDVSGRPFIPGSSFKGVLRASLESLLRGLGDDATMQRRFACNVINPAERCVSDAEYSAWYRELTADRATLAQRVVERSCLICQTFGSTRLAAHVAVRDLAVETSSWFGQFEVRQGVALDRDTETAYPAALYSFETVPPGTRFNLEVVGDNLRDWQKGLLWLGLQPFVRGEGSIGGARSRGLGAVELQAGDWSVWDAEPGNADSIIAFLIEGAQTVQTAQSDAWRDALLRQLQDTPLQGVRDA